MPGVPLLSVVVPTRNESENAPALVARVLAALPGVSTEIWFVDDSDDDTPAVLERLAADHGGRVRVVLRTGEERAGGLSTAVVTGVRLATGRYVCVMDADLQHPPETIQEMLGAAERGADLVVASRYAPGGSAGGLDGAIRRTVSGAATRLARLLFREARRSTDPLSGFFLCRRALLAGVELRPVGFKILLELLVLLPGVEVRDVPLRFDQRHAGRSKASASQGLEYLRHVRSLVLDVRGAARSLKFAAVGLSGLGVFLPLLALGDHLRLPALAAFLPAFAVSLLWNGVLNRRWTFADLRQAGGRRGAYVTTALGAGLVMFAAYAALVALTPLPLVAAGAVAAGVAALVNGVANLPLVRAARSPWSQVVADRGVQASLDALAEQVGADRAYVVPAVGLRAEPASLVASLVAAAVARRQAVAATALSSYRPQRRTNLDATSLLVVPVVAGDDVVAAVVCERQAPRGFDQTALDTATAAVHRLALGRAPERDAVGAGMPSEVAG